MMYTSGVDTSTHIFNADDDYLLNKPYHIYPSHKKEDSKSASHSNTIFWVAVSALVGFALMALIMNNTAVSGIFNPPKNCSTTLSSGACSINRPYYCDNGNLIENAEKCGCDDGYRVYKEKCIKKIICTDGTFWPDCSTNKPYQCQKGGLVTNATYCGCPEDQILSGDVCKPVQKCPDGTIEGRCSPNKPYYCEKGALIGRSSICGCPEGSTIESISNHNTDRCVSSNSQNYQNTPVQKPSSPIQLITDVSDIEKKIHDYINNERITHGLPPLNWDDNLANVAREHSKNMATNNFFSHVNPAGQDPSARAISAGYSCFKNYGSYYTSGIAENIYTKSSVGIAYFVDAEAHGAVNSWMSSEGHRQNILTPTYSAEGIGVAIGPGGGIYVTEDFC